MPGQLFDQAHAYVAAMTQCDVNQAVINVRMIHDTDKAVPAIAMRGRLGDLWTRVCSWNDNGYGAFINVADMSETGNTYESVRATRVAVIDLDNLSAVQNFDRAANWSPLPQFGVETSPNKFHVYWSVPYYLDNDHYTLRQRKLRQYFDGDKTVVDPTRVLRLPGTLHLKGEPFMVRCFSLGGYGQVTSHEAIDGALAAVNVIDGASGTRHDLGDPALSAPSLSWLQRGLDLIDPNKLDRGEWIATTSAIKQAGWLHATPEALFEIWSKWCARYGANDTGENLKQWDSIRNTELGWPSIMRRAPALSLAGVEQSAPVAAGAAGEPVATTNAGTVPPMPEPPPLDCSGEYLTHLEQQQWFKHCVFIVSRGEILDPKGHFLNATKFNGAFGGKKFLIDSEGKTVNEAWQAATRSTLWQVPKADHTRFLPFEPYQAMIEDALGRNGLNTYRPAKIGRVAGDVTPFLNHVAALVATPGDQKILLDYLAHNVKYPGDKIPWAPVIQSAEGAGKGLIKAIMKNAMGEPYVYFPNAKELTDSGSQFNAWMRHKLFILADEIKVDDRRDLIEVLKPMISEEVIEVQGNGHDQQLEDNFSNWLFYTNYKDAVPVNKNGRRFAIMYSPLQTADDLTRRGMTEAYFNAIYLWAKDSKRGGGDGAKIVTNWLLDYPIERGAIPMRAPVTSSTDEAVLMSRSPVERMIDDALDDALPGFRGGWISSTSVIKRAKETSTVRGALSPQVVASILEAKGYVLCGRAPRSFFQEGPETRSTLYHIDRLADMAGFGAAQGWE